MPPVARATIGALLCAVQAAPAFADGDRKKGQALAEKHCARCHVIGEYNKFGGLGSTPSFQLLAGLEDGMTRFQSFYERRPHPAFVTVPGVPKWSKAKPYAIPFTVTPETIDDLMTFVKTLERKTLLGIPVGRARGRRMRTR